MGLKKSNNAGEPRMWLKLKQAQHCTCVEWGGRGSDVSELLLVRTLIH